MKYLLNPILKFAFAVFATYLWACIILIAMATDLFWNFALPKWEWYQYRYSYYLQEVDWSPYFKPNPNATSGHVIFKTVFHYIWNIQPKK